MAKEQLDAESLVFVVDDDASVRQALTSLLQSIGLRVEAFGSAADFLKKGRMADGIAAACLILDVRLPGLSGLDFQAELAKADTHLPIIFTVAVAPHCSTERQVYQAGGITAQDDRVFGTGSFSAQSRQSISRSSLNGFFRKREAAVLKALAPASSADSALIKIIGLR